LNFARNYIILIAKFKSHNSLLQISHKFEKTTYYNTFSRDYTNAGNLNYNLENRKIKWVKPQRCSQLDGATHWHNLAGWSGSLPAKRSVSWPTQRGGLLMQSSGLVRRLVNMTWCPGRWRGKGGTPIRGGMSGQLGSYTN
jgi:hypothetical protein